MHPTPVHVDAGHSEEASFRRKLQGLLCFRLILAVFFLLVTLIAQSRREGDLLAAHLQPLYFLACILFGFTIVAAFSLKRVKNLKAFTYLQLFFDVEAVTFLVYLSGGVESPYPFLYMPVIISASVLLYRRGGFLIASLSSFSYGLLLDLQFFEWISPLQIVFGRSLSRDSGAYLSSILMSIAGFYLVAFLSGYLAEELQKSSRQVRIQERDLQKLEMLHSNIVQSMNSGLLTVNSSGLIDFSNIAAEEILGIPSGQLRGMPVQDILHSCNPLSWVSMQGIHARGSSELLRRREINYRRRSGEELCLGYTISILQKEDGANAGWVIIFQDLTRFKAMEEHLQRMERVALAGRIAAEIAHEIKNPLAAMSGAIQMLQDEKQNSPLESRLMGIALREIQRINELVTDFLWLSRGVRKPEKVEDVSACVLINEVLALLKAKEKIGSTHRVDTHFECTPVFSMDPNHFHQILWNLLANALEAMPDGGELSVRVRLREKEASNREEACIEISDTGCGIPDDARDRIFEPFYTTKKDGTGLGLSIVYQLVETAGGRIQAVPRTPQGTTFSLFFPLVSSFPLAK